MENFQGEYVCSADLFILRCSNRLFYVSMYNDARGDPEIQRTRANKPLEVPEWLWRERALYVLDPPDDESDWNPTPAQMQSLAVCSDDDMRYDKKVIEGAKELKQGRMLDTSDWKLSVFGDTSDVMSEQE